MTNLKENKAGHTLRLFEGETVLIATAIIGFGFAVFVAVYMMLYGTIIPPEGNAQSAFSFNAAIALFILSIAALLPLSGLKTRSRAIVRWMLTCAALLSYLIETVQHLRGLNPRFPQSGAVRNDRLVSANSVQFRTRWPF